MTGPAAPKRAMLSRTADNLYWLGRAMERADFVARMIEVTQRLTSLPRLNENGTEWESALEACGVAELYREHHERVEESSAVAFLTFDRRNPSSIRNCLMSARDNGRSVRTALTVEMWEGINSAWLELRRFEESRPEGQDEREALQRFLEFVKMTSIQFDGSAYRTMLRNDAYWFSRLGLYVERADNTARILDVKYHVLLPDVEAVGGSMDYFQWTAILRAVSAVTAYHWVYRESVRPWLIADLLILRPEMPRSLLSCYENIVLYLDAIGHAYGRQGPAQDLARSMAGRLRDAGIDDIFETGLHEFITAFIEENNGLAATIAAQFLF